MLNINFVPDDYIQKRESMRANLLCLVLLLVMMVALAAAFMVLKVRQRAIATQAATVSTKMDQAKKDIAKLEELQAQRQSIMQAALTTTELIEPVPRSVFLAEITNCLPSGVSLRLLKLTEKKIEVKTAAAKNTYDQAKANSSQANSKTAPPAKVTETTIEIEGIAPSDIQVAGYIAQLNNSILLDNVSLVQSKEYKKDQDENALVFREFKLTASLKKDMHLSQKDIDQIRSRRQNTL